MLQERIENEAPARGTIPSISGLSAFATLPFSQRTFRGLADADYTTMTEIQNASIPHALCGRDILGAAKTGSGKTLSFILPILEKLYRNQWSKNDGPGAIILSPTRELAGQTFQVLRLVGKHHTSLTVGLLIGGKRDFPIEQQHVPTTNIVVATPGRLLQHLEQTPYFDVGSVQMLVLDEADRILDMGFRDQLVRILDYLPSEKQTLLFSATQTKDVKALATLSMNRKNLEYIGVHDKELVDTPDALVQSYVLVPVQHKLNCAYSFLKSHLKCKTIMFFATCSQVRHAWDLFCRLRPGLSVLALHGKLTQAKRMEIYDKFVSTPHAVLFATDIASRGLDFPNVDWVVQVDAPEDQDMYLHRVGRTARYKSKGNALLLLDPLEESTIQSFTLKVPLKKKSINPTKTVLVTQKAASVVASDVKLNQLAKKSFLSYVRSLALLPKRTFDVTKLNLQEYATSLGLASMPNLRFLDSITSREGLRQTKNVNRKLQKLKEQIKAEKLAKKIAKLKPEAARKRLREEMEKDDKNLNETSLSDDDHDDDLLVVKSRQGPNGEMIIIENDQKDGTKIDGTTNSIHQVSKSRKPKKIRIDASSSNDNKHVVFNDDGEEEDDILVAATKNSIETILDSNDLEQANVEYMEQVRQRLERTKEQDKLDEKQRIREKHRKKRLQDKVDNNNQNGDGGGPVEMVATLAAGDSVDESDNESSASSSTSSSSSDFSVHLENTKKKAKKKINESDSDSDSDSDSEMDVAAQEDLALSLIRGS